MIIGNIIGGAITPKSYVIEAEDGQEMYAVLVGEETVFTATENDIREGKTAGTSKGLITGTKVIPSYHTIQGTQVIKVGSPLAISGLTANDNYDYTKLQSIICSFNTNLANSVAAEKVSIGDSVYAVQSTEVISEIIKDRDNRKINFGITNDTDDYLIVRFITYKEIE